MIPTIDAPFSAATPAVLPFWQPRRSLRTLYPTILDIPLMTFLFMTKAFYRHRRHSLRTLHPPVFRVITIPQIA